MISYLHAGHISGSDWLIGLGAIFIFARHNIVAFMAGQPYNSFWLCDAAGGLVGFAILLRSPTLSAVCLMYLLPGLIAWTMNMSLGHGPKTWGSRLAGAALHIGCFAAAAYAVHRNGYAPHAWIAAIAFQGALYAFCRFAIPAKYNINAVHTTPVGWSFLDGNPVRYYCLYLVVSLSFALIGQGLTYAVSFVWRTT